MARYCERPGCSVVAEVAYGFDAAQLMVWIDRLDKAQESRAGVLCRRHAEAMVVPLGWMCDDRRNPTPQLFRTPDVVPVPPRPRSSPRHAVAQRVAEQLGLDELDVPDLVGASAVATSVGADDLGAAGDVEPWKPVFDHTDDLDGLLMANSPLLSRAFRGRKPGR
jgi:hypothetical protein